MSAEKRQWVVQRAHDVTGERFSGHTPSGDTGGINEMDPPLCGSAVISHTEVSETDHATPARRTSPMQHELRTVAIDLAKKVSLNFSGFVAS